MNLFLNLINSQQGDYSRYIFFYINYLLFLHLQSIDYKILKNSNVLTLSSFQKQYLINDGFDSKNLKRLFCNEPSSTENFHNRLMFPITFFIDKFG